MIIILSAEYISPSLSLFSYASCSCHRDVYEDDIDDDDGDDNNDGTDDI